MYTEFKYTVNGKEQKKVVCTYSAIAYNKALEDVSKIADVGSIVITTYGN